jgi:hypothetical protein
VRPAPPSGVPQNLELRRRPGLPRLTTSPADQSFSGLFLRLGESTIVLPARLRYNQVRNNCRLILGRDMKRWMVIILCALAFLSGIALTLSFIFLNRNRVPTKWFVFDSLKFDKQDDKYLSKLIGFSTESLFVSDLPLPEVKRVELSVKFKELSPQQTHNIGLGYLLKITIGKLDKKNVPEKYLKSREEDFKGRTLTVPPKDELLYEFIIHIVLKDNDGFEIYRTKPITIMALTGKTNVFQELAPDLIPRALIKKMKYIEPKILISKCLDYEPD